MASDGGPAFPRTLLYEDMDGAMNAVSYHQMAGMSLHDFFAAAAIQGMLAAGGRANLVSDAFDIADTAIHERERRRANRPST